METLNATQFKNYLESLEVTQKENLIYAQDEVGPVCEINITTMQNEVSDLCTVDGLEYLLTEDQKDAIYKLVYDSIDNSTAENAHDIDEAHFQLNIY